MDEIDNITEKKNAFITGVWSERVLVITEDYEIKGYVFMPKTGRRNRILSDILNSTKRFVAIKNCKLKHRNSANRVTEAHDFIQLNLDSIVLIRPALQEE
ncbi:MAG: hypothetical protein MJ180_04650 [Candidatus Gastranaerophilales bacterium]|nr:hypothetical protein [Candidatus Gastranaerophilales bacterium]